MNITKINVNEKQILFENHFGTEDAYIYIQSISLLKTLLIDSTTTYLPWLITWM